MTGEQATLQSDEGVAENMLNLFFERPVCATEKITGSTSLTAPNFRK